jgi:polysaccharide export outer membrane protein
VISPAPAASPSYRILVDDTLEISVVSQNGLGQQVVARTVTVLNDGTVDLPVMGEIKIVNMTVGELRKKIRARMSKQIRDPQVNIAVRDRVRAQVTTLGVLKGGKIVLREGWRVRDVIASAGGLPTDRYEYYRASLTRGKNNQTLPIDLQKLLVDSDQSQNYLLEPDDTLLIQEVDQAQKQVQVIGQVLKAGPVELPRTRSIIDVLQAAGGPNDRAALNDATIERGSTTIKVPLRDNVRNGTEPSEKLEPGDRLVIPENRREYYMLGAVGAGGTKPFPEDRKLTVFTAISDAGGQVSGAELKKTRLTRKTPDGGTTSQEINVEKMLKTGDLSKDVAMQPGDTIYVPQTGGRRGIGLQEIVTYVSIITGLYTVTQLFRR